jgi:hypothetical protein
MDNTPLVQTVPDKVVSVFARRSLNGALFPGHPVNITIPGYTSRVEWLKDAKGLQRYNPCQHYVKQCSLDRLFVEGSDTWYSTGDHSQGYWDVTWADTSSCWDGSRYGSDSSYSHSGVFGSWTKPITGLPVLYVDDSTGRYINQPEYYHIKSLIDRSLIAMLPGIKPKTSLPNALFELRDMKTLVRTTARIQTAFDATKRLVEALSLSKQALKLLSGKTKAGFARAALKSVLKSGADSYLQAQFNIAPLLRDIAAVKGSVSDARNQLNKLIAGMRKAQVLHYKASMRDIYVPSSTSRSIAIPNVFVQSTTDGRRDVTYPIAMFYATIEYEYDLPLFNPLEDYLPAALGDVLGSNWNPQIIWNAIPWSFVYDWVAGIGRWLDQFKTRNIEPVTVIRRYCYTTHVKREITLFHGEGGNNAIPFARYWEEAYKRLPTNPDLQRSLEVTGLNPKEFSLAAALALSR